MQICTTVAWVFPQDVTSSELIKTFLRTIFSKQSVRKSLFWVTHALPAEKKNLIKNIKNKIFLRKDAKRYTCIHVTNQGIGSSRSSFIGGQIRFTLEYFNTDMKPLTLSACNFLTLTLFIYLKIVHVILNQPLCNISNQLPLIPLGNLSRNTISLHKNEVVH